MRSSLSWKMRAARHTVYRGNATRPRPASSTAESGSRPPSSSAASDRSKSSRARENTARGPPCTRSAGPAASFALRIREANGFRAFQHLDIGF